MTEHRAVRHIYTGPSLLPDEVQRHRAAVRALTLHGLAHMPPPYLCWNTMAQPDYHECEEMWLR